MPLNERCLQRLSTVDPKPPEGSVRGVTGLLIEAQGPSAPVGSVVRIAAAGGSLPAEVVGFDGGRVLLMSFEASNRVRLGDRVRLARNGPPRATARWIGRVVDGLGRPLDGGPLLDSAPAGDPPNPMNPLRRRPLDQPMVTGVRAIDALLPCARGQRVGIFGGSGVGKSTLLAQMARGAEADVAVIAMVGERGREVKEFVENELGPAGLRHSVVVASTSEAAPLMRLRAAETALTAAEALRDEGRSVLLIFDSLTRVAMAQREVGLAAGEPPTARGYTPSVFSLLPRLIERAGAFETGSITAFFTVLVEGDDMSDPVADSARSLLDGHIVLSRALGERAHFPAIDIGQSLSRLASVVSTAEQRTLSDRLRRLLATHRQAEDLIAVGAYAPGQDAELDEAVALRPAIEAFLRQTPDVSVALDATLEQLRQALSSPTIGAPAGR